jgi:SAM-dependent methyltransferase
LRVDRWLYKKGQYHELFIGDLSNGYPEIPPNSYDASVCEQVFEHLDRIDGAVATLTRILKPGGRLVIGVPIFLPPLHLIRKHIIPIFDRIFAPEKSRDHHQAFSQFSMLRELKKHPSLHLLEVRGFRVISGGLLLPLGKLPLVVAAQPPNRRTRAGGMRRNPSCPNEDKDRHPSDPFRGLAMRGIIRLGVHADGERGPE